MEEQSPAPPSEPQADAEQPMLWREKLVAIITAPGELFENVRLTGKTSSNWLVPWAVFATVAVLLSQLIVHNPSLGEQMTAVLKKGFDKSVEKAIQEGKITQEQAEQQFEELVKPGSTGFTLLSIAGAVAGTFVALFLVSLMCWLVGKSAMHASAPFMKVVEIIGLTLFIGAIEQIVTTIMIFSLNSIYATPSLAAFVSNFSVENRLHLALARVNAFTLWDLSVVSIGLSKLFQRDFPKVLVLVFMLWILWSVFGIYTGVTMS